MQNKKHLEAPGSDEEGATACIGIFDSGVGGLSVLRTLRERLPDAPMVYIGDVAFATYGERAADEVIARCTLIVERLVADGACIVVIACNTATVLAIEALRAHWPGLSFVGVEPGVKPAVARSRTRRIAVMTTPATATSTRLRHLIERYADDIFVHVRACPELAGAIERGVLSGPVLVDILRPHCDDIAAANVDTVVLGCTHYPFVADDIRFLLGSDITLIDTAVAVAERTASVWEQLLPRFDPQPGLRVMSTGQTDTMQRLLGVCRELRGAGVERLVL